MWSSCRLLYVLAKHCGIRAISELASTALSIFETRRDVFLMLSRYDIDCVTTDNSVYIARSSDCLWWWTPTGRVAVKRSMLLFCVSGKACLPYEVVCLTARLSLISHYWYRNRFGAPIGPGCRYTCTSIAAKNTMLGCAGSTKSSLRPFRGNVWIFCDSL